VTLFRRWSLLLTFLALFLVHERQTSAPGAPSRLRAEAVAESVAPLPAPSLERPADQPVPVAALSDDRADVDENGPPPRAGDWRDLLRSGPRGAGAGFDRPVSLRPATAQAKWFHRAWGQP
jgi:hypothetical protein